MTTDIGKSLTLNCLVCDEELKVPDNRADFKGQIRCKCQLLYQVKLKDNKCEGLSIINEVTDTLAKPQFRKLLPDGTLEIYLHPGQKAVMASKARFAFMIGGTQVGKTCLGSHWLYDRIEETAVTGESNDYLATTANYDLFKLKMLPELLEVYERLLRVGKYWAGERVIEIAENLIPGNFKAQRQDDPMWARIILRSAEAEAGLESSTVKAAWCDEIGQPSFKRTAWEAILRRTGFYQARILGTTTLYEWNWLKNEIYDPWQAGNKDIDIIQVDSTVNPAFPKEEYERARATLPAWKFDLFYRGRYAKPAGLIYDAFNEDVCKIPRFPLDDEAHKNWPRYVGHDFGTANPAAVFYAQDPGTGFFYLYYEYLPGSGRSTAEHSEEFKRMTAGLNVIKRAGGSHQEEEIREAYIAHGWPIQEPKFSQRVEAGIDRVYALHKLNKVFVFKDMYHYLDEKMSYSYKLDDNYNPTNEIADKARFHLMDAERGILSDFTPETVESNRPVTRRSNRF